MIEKNKTYTIEITDVTAEGSGVGHIDGFAVFVPGTVSGDRVLVLIVKVLKNYAYGKMLDIITPSPDRCDVSCPAFAKCGGCKFLHIKYEKQLEIKKNIVRNALKRIGGIDCETDEIIGADNPERYRNKMIFPVGEDREGNPVCGFFRERSHDIIPLADCLLGAEFNAPVIAAVKEYMTENHVDSYNEETHSGMIRRIFTRRGTQSGEIMIVISANGEELPNKNDLVERLRKISPDVVSIILNVNKKRTNLVLGDRNIILYGKSTISDRLCGMDYEISPYSFFQINHEQTEKLYKKAIEYADIKKDDEVIDIYCGIGTISLYAARFAKHVTGVEIVPEAIENAKENAERNGIENAEFFCSDASMLVPKLIEKGISPNVVILDPPRKGSDPRTLAAIVRSGAARVVYVSCNPATLARDVKFLSENGYAAKKVCAVDMFPNTGHVETVVLLCRKTPDDVIKVKLSLDELELTSAESKATYEKIKEYVMRNFGLKVSTLYIAQTKRKFGIDMGENYNMPKSLESTQPQCPPDKEAAIVKALEHFKMI